MKLSRAQVRGFRLRTHHLDRRYPMEELEAVAGACGLINSPPGTWETAAFVRLEGCTLSALEKALYQDKTLLQAWSIRGIPLVFPTAQAGVFLSPLTAGPGEDPWIYTRGIAAALDHLGMGFDETLALVRQAAGWLEGHTVKSKEALDQVLAGLVADLLPPHRRARWNDPSMYGSPDRQTVGGAAVSFLLRPCAFGGQVVFGRREGRYPTFTAPRRWLGRPLPDCPDGAQTLVRRFLRCCGPATRRELADWLGSSPAQAARLWGLVEEELEPVEVEGRRRFALSDHRADLLAGEEGERVLLLGPHDPYLDLRDRELILPDRARQRALWRTVGSPGAVLLGGRVVGLWRGRTQGGRLSLSVTLWAPLSPLQQSRLEEQGQAYAAFRDLTLKAWTVTLEG